MVDADDLSDAEATEMLQRLHVAEARHRIQQLNGGGRKPCKEKHYKEARVAAKSELSPSAPEM